MSRGTGRRDVQRKRRRQRRARRAALFLVIKRYVDGVVGANLEAWGAEIQRALWRAEVIGQGAIDADRAQAQLEDK